MATLQVKDMDDHLYALLREKAQSENRSISQEVISILKSYLSNPRVYSRNPAEEFLTLTGAWKDSRSADQIIREVIRSRTENSRFDRKNDIFD